MQRETAISWLWWVQGGEETKHSYVGSTTTVVDNCSNRLVPEVSVYFNPHQLRCIARDPSYMYYTLKGYIILYGYGMLQLCILTEGG